MWVRNGENMDQPELFNIQKDDDSEYMKADREFFRQNPDKEFYVRKRFAGEMLSGNPPNVIVRSLAQGVRTRIPCFKDPMTAQDIAEMTRELKYYKDLTALEYMVKRKGKAKKSKKINKGFGKV